MAWSESVDLRDLIAHRPSPLQSLAAVSWLVAGIVLIDLSATPRGGAVTFLPDDAVISCRAILPQCFQRDDWAALCADDLTVAEGHPEACRASGFEAGKPPQGR